MKTLSEEIISRIKEMNTILSQSGITSKQEPEAGEKFYFIPNKETPVIRKWVDLMEEDAITLV